MKKTLLLLSAMFLATALFSAQAGKISFIRDGQRLTYGIQKFDTLGKMKILDTIRISPEVAYEAAIYGPVLLKNDVDYSPGTLANFYKTKKTVTSWRAVYNPKDQTVRAEKIYPPLKEDIINRLAIFLFAMAVFLPIIISAYRKNNWKKINKIWKVLISFLLIMSAVLLLLLVAFDGNASLHSLFWLSLAIPCALMGGHAFLSFSDSDMGLLIYCLPIFAIILLAMFGFSWVFAAYISIALLSWLISRWWLNKKLASKK